MLVEWFEKRFTLCLKYKSVHGDMGRKAIENRSSNDLNWVKIKFQMFRKLVSYVFRQYWLTVSVTAALCHHNGHKGL